MVRKTLRREFNFFKDMETNVKLPYLCISREDFKLMRNLLEPEEMGEMLMMLEDYFYDGVEPVFSTKVMKGVWENVSDNIKRRADGYLRKVKNLKQNKTKNIEIPSNTEFETKKVNESVNEAKTELFKVAAVKEKVNENIGDFRPEIPQDDTRVQQDIESVLKGQEIGKNEVFDIPSDVAEKIKAVTSNSSLEINEKYKGIAGILKSYLRNVPSRKHSEIVDFFYKQFSKAA